jgi:hypothetical protein
MGTCRPWADQRAAIIRAHGTRRSPDLAQVAATAMRTVGYPQLIGGGQAGHVPMK